VPKTVRPEPLCTLWLREPFAVLVLFARLMAVWFEDLKGTPLQWQGEL